MNQEIEGSPLVSIIVVTYNSSAFVLETLDSARDQTYKNIELIITDDCSCDETVKVCRDWLSENGGRFVRTELIISPVNTGISPNCNRGLRAAEGAWLKFIAGDDIMLSNCITDNIDHLTGNASFLFSRHIWFRVNSEGKICVPAEKKVVDRYWTNLEETFFLKSPRKQYKLLIKYNRLPASTAFIKREALISLGGFDEEIPMVDDYPLWIRATRDNYKLLFFNKETVLYRKHESAVSNSGNMNIVYIRNNYKLYKKYRLSLGTIHHLLFHLSINLNYQNQLLAVKLGRRTLINKFLQAFDPNFLKNTFLQKDILTEIYNGPFLEFEKFNN